MIILRKKGAYLLIFVDDNIIAYNCENGSQKTMKIPEPPVQVLTKSLEEVLKPENRKVTSVCASKNGDLLAVTLQNKQLIIYDKNFNVLNNIITNRAVSRVKYTREDDVLIADKTGDVFLYKFKSDTEPELLLGHLSMLLDIIVSACGKYVITCDRDEKIRVSCYPNAYNIASYCLGHREFVTNLEISGEILISASGDGTIRFWDFPNGKQLSSINTNDHVQDKTAVEKFCKEMDTENVDVTALPIVDMQVFESDVTYIAVTLVEFNGVQLYRMEVKDGVVDVRFWENILVCSEVVSFCLSDELLILVKNELLVYKLNEDGRYVKVDLEEISGFYDTCKSLFTRHNASNAVSSLYKRKYDNVQEYLEKKKQRLESKS